MGKRSIEERILEEGSFLLEVLRKTEGQPTPWNHIHPTLWAPGPGCEQKVLEASHSAHSGHYPSWRLMGMGVSEACLMITALLCYL